METVRSKDGTPIAYERTGAGPALILVDGALCSRQFGPMPTLAPLLARHYTVYFYDRRGRGDSGDTRPYAPEREVEDIAALIDVAGGTANVLGLSSGAALALQAAASGLPITKVAAYEPPFMVDDGGRHAAADHPARLTEMVEAGRRGDAVRYFMRDMVGMPGLMVAMMRWMWWVWPKLEAVAHTLPYDAAVLGDWTPPARLKDIRVPTLAMYGGKTDAKLKAGTKAAAAAIPGAIPRELPGQTHNVDAKVLAPVVAEFFGV